jgi:hypothetical protein
MQFFAFSAVSVGKLKEIQNGGKRARRGVDQWDRVRCEHSEGIEHLLTAVQQSTTASDDLMQIMY